MKLRLLCSLVVIGLAYAVVAAAGPPPFPPPTIHGTYAVVGSLACLNAPGFSPGSSTNPTPGVPLPNSGFNANFDPIYPDSSFANIADIEGVFTFDGHGNGTRSGTNVSMTPRPTPGPAGNYPAFGPSMSSNTFTGSFTYVVNSDGTFTFVTSDTTGTFLTGGRTGQTFSVNVIEGTGMIGEGGLTLTLATITPTVETIVFSNGDAWPRVCHRQRTLTKIH